MSIVEITLAWIIGLVTFRCASFFPLTTSAVLLVSSALWFLRPPRRVGSARCAAFLLGTAIAGLAFTAYRARIAADDISHFASEDKRRVTGRILCPIEQGPDKETFILLVSGVESEGGGLIPASGRLRVSVYDEPGSIECGTAVAMTARIRRPKNFESPGTFDFISHLADQGVFALASVAQWDQVSIVALPSRWAWGTMLARLRARAADIIDRAADPDEAEILKALVLGEEGSIPRTIWRSYAAAGVVHLLSISGLHVGFIALLMIGFFRTGFRHLPDPIILALNRRLWTATRLAALVTLPAVVFYAFFAGAQVATLRAATMIAVALAGVMIFRDATAGQLLAFAALVLLVANPSALWMIGFQLSFVSVLALILLARIRWRERDPLLPEEESGFLGRIWMRTTDLWWVSVAATIGTAPLTALYFHQVSLIGLAANLVLVPFSGLVIGVGFLAILLAGFWPSAALVAACLAGTGITAMNHVVDGAASVPYAVVHPASPPVILIAAYFVLVAAFVAARGARIRILLGVGWFALSLFALTLPWDQVPPGEIRAAFLDVGQGDAAVVETADRVIVIDGGGSRSESLDIGEAVVETYLWERGIRRINWVVATHPQLDHMEGLLSVIRDFKVGALVDNGIDRPWGVSRAWNRTAQLRHIPRRIASPGLVLIESPDLRAEVLWPSEEARRRGEERGGLNNASVVVKIQNRGATFLFTGDLEARGEAGLAANGGDLSASVLKVPHHGARRSLDPLFLARVHPDVAIISAGEGNRYGHPAPEALEAYGRMGARIVRTDRDGTIVIETRGPGIRIRRTAGIRVRPVTWTRLAPEGEWENYRRWIGAGWEAVR